MAMLGGVFLDVVTSDDPVHSYEITEKAVENGESIADHMKANPYTLSISGIVVGDDASERLQKIKYFQSDRRLVDYVNRVIYKNMAIENISTNHGAEIANGFLFTIQLRQVRVVSPQEVQITNIPPPVQTKTKEKAKAGKKQAKSQKSKDNQDLIAKIKGFFAKGAD